jgi:hypothetical protein
MRNWHSVKAERPNQHPIFSTQAVLRFCLKSSGCPITSSQIIVSHFHLRHFLKACALAYLGRGWLTIGLRPRTEHYLSLRHDRHVHFPNGRTVNWVLNLPFSHDRHNGRTVDWSLSAASWVPAESDQSTVRTLPKIQRGISSLSASRLFYMLTPSYTATPLGPNRPHWLCQRGRPAPCL